MKIILGILLAVIIIAAVVVVYIINHEDYCEDCGSAENGEGCDICPYRK